MSNRQYRTNQMSFGMMSKLASSHSLYSLPFSAASKSSSDDQSVDESQQQSNKAVSEEKPVNTGENEAKSLPNSVENMVVKKASGFQTSLFERLNEQRLAEPAICDLAINVENKTYYAHKCLLVASCDYFAAMMLRSGMLETRQDTIELKGVSALGLRGVLDFIYTGELRLTLGNVADLVRAVSHLQVKYALELCEEFLCEQLNETNCIDILNLVDIFSIKDIKSEIDAYILRNFEKLIQNGQFKKLKLDQLSYYLSSNKLKLFPEIVVFGACVTWWQSAQSSNEKDSSSSSSSSFYELAKLVRFNTMKPEEFINVVTKHELMKNDPQCRELLIQGYEYFALPSKQFTCASPQSVIRNEAVMVCVNESMYILNKKEDCWQYLCQSHATSKILSQKFVVVNNFLYACGGYSEKERETCDKCYRFDPRNGQWQSIASMNEKRQFFTLAACNDTIVAVGGVFGSIGNFYATFPISSPIECYSIERNEWTSVPIDESQLPILKWPGVCVFRRRSDDDPEDAPPRQYVFVVCGKHIKKNTLSEQAFLVDVDRCRVEVCPGPLTARFNPSVFYYDNRIILFAGEDEKFRLAPCIESFDLRTRQWTEIATVPISLSYQCISSTRMLDAKINYIIEEHDGPFSEAYVLRSASFDIDRMCFDTPIELPIPSTLASKWCYLVFPLEFLDKYYSLTADDD